MLCARSRVGSFARLADFARAPREDSETRDLGTGRVQEENRSPGLTELAVNYTSARAR